MLKNMLKKVKYFMLTDLFYTLFFTECLLLKYTSTYYRIAYILVCKMEEYTNARK